MNIIDHCIGFICAKRKEFLLLVQDTHTNHSLGKIIIIISVQFEINVHKKDLEREKQR